MRSTLGSIRRHHLVTACAALAIAALLLYRRPSEQHTAETLPAENAATESQAPEIKPSKIEPLDIETYLRDHASWEFLDPPELQYSCAVASDQFEDDFARQLQNGKPSEQLAAARRLWEGRSRRQAENVLRFVGTAPAHLEGLREFKEKLNSELAPVAVLRKLKGGKYKWGAWLAYLRPHEQLVPVLLEALERRPEMRPETMLALGKSGDARALLPLTTFLKNGYSQTAGAAADALGRLGDPAVEPILIEALRQNNGWMHVNVSGALARIGSRRALPALERLAEDDSYTGALNVKECTIFAMSEICRRDRR